MVVPSSHHVRRLSKGPRVDTIIQREGRRSKIEMRTKKSRAFSFHFRDNNTTPPSTPFKYKHKISLFSLLPLPMPSSSSPSPSLSGSIIFFFSLLYTLFRFSLFCGLRWFALQLIISPLSYPPFSSLLALLPYLPHRRHHLSFSLFLCLSFLFGLPAHSLSPSILSLSISPSPLLYAAIYGHYAQAPIYNTIRCNAGHKIKLGL